MVYTKKKKSYGNKYSRRRRASARRSVSSRAPYRKRITRRMNRAVSLPKYFVTQMNPFDNQGYGARIPDTNTAPSSAFYTYDEGVLATSAASKTIGILLQPNSTTLAQKGIEGISPAFTWNGTDWDDASTARAKAIAVADNYCVVRPVSHGVRLTAGGASSGLTGFVHVALISINTLAGFPNATTTGIPQSLSNMASLPHYRRITVSSLAENPFVIVNRFLDETAHRYIGTRSSAGGTMNQDIPETGSTYGTFNTPNSWMYILVVLESTAAGANSINFEDVCHHEGQSKASGLARDFDAEAPNRPLLERVSHAVAVTNASFYENQAEFATRVNRSLAVLGGGGSRITSTQMSGGQGFSKTSVGGTRNM